MNPVAHNLNLNLRADTPNGMARAKAIHRAGEIQPEPTALVSYSSTGSVYILGNDEAARRVATQLAQHPTLECTLVIVDDANDNPYLKLEAIPNNVSANKHAALSATLQGSIVAVKGYLGQFDIVLQTPLERTSLQEILGTNQVHIDILLDLTNAGLIASEIKPPGYYAAGKDEAALQLALSEIPELIGEFEKPQYFHYDSDICAHSRSQMTACTRCIESCPTDAITSIGDTISVNANLCQGAGSCATACPTGAITYTYPRLEDNLQRLHVMLSTYQQAGGEDAVILLHDATSGRLAIEAIAGQLPDNVMPVELEELGSMGMDGWLAALSYGAGAVVLFATSETSARVVKELNAQLSYVAAIIAGMGFPAETIQLVNASENHFMESIATLRPVRGIPIAAFFESNNKRKVIRAAVDHLYEYASARRPLAILPTGAPFGEVWLDPGRCTLCMSCVWHCAGKALIAGGDKPQLKFVENDCVQCGLCARTCPEDAIGPSPRFLYVKEHRESPRILYEEQPFLCIRCGKAFATQSVIERMTSKLKQHAMFQGDALQRIQMCEDCRVKDIYAAELKQRDEQKQKEQQELQQRKTSTREEIT
ncbi:4Fe-4S binding protein [Kaarinaea lacus]